MVMYIGLYHGVWAIAMVTFDVPREIYAYRQGDLLSSH